MVKKICNFLSTIVLVVLLAAAAVILVPMLLGYKEMAVLSGSAVRQHGTHHPGGKPGIRKAGGGQRAGSR